MKLYQTAPRMKTQFRHYQNVLFNRARIEEANPRADPG